ncbi:MAG: PKD domain-containing protein [Candidatus Anstonellales archaeon]
MGNWEQRERKVEAKLLEEGIPVELINRSIPSWLSRGWFRRFRRRVSIKRFGRVIFTFARGPPYEIFKRFLLSAGIASLLFLGCGGEKGSSPIICTKDSDCGAGYVCQNNSCVEKPNHAPIANAGPDQQAYLGDTVYLDGSQSSDPDNDPLTYVWRQTSGPAVSLNNSDKDIANFTASATGTLEFKLKVCDSKNACSEDSALVTILQKQVQSNNAPLVQLAKSLLPEGFDEDCYNNYLTAADKNGICGGSGYNLHNNIKGGHTVNICGSATDPEGDPVSYLWIQKSGPAGYGATIATPNNPCTDVTFPNYPNELSGDYVFTLRACDDKNACGSADMTVKVRKNLPPVADAGGDTGCTVNYPCGLPYPQNNHDKDGQGGIYGGIIKCHFDFGDGQSYEETPDNAPDGNFDCDVEHTYTSNGWYTVTLTITDNNNSTNQDTCQVFINN